MIQGGPTAKYSDNSSESAAGKIEPADRRSPTNSAQRRANARPCTGSVGRWLAMKAPRPAGISHEGITSGARINMSGSNSTTHVDGRSRFSASQCSTERGLL
eukprot:CAMPEP_0170281282 /NCGR_PEP_ID=MMETSP0116_2-20130129/40660_1 /TAXON_ID=400756 /ORGANISM="Durinskia baltica, Strain CSIRO CS-38" /LENGTH=101 /DNA_ID=CAMNT_0010532623 /DNA_START=564 /DNA_END=870 /DNA_ORIENTATION=+